MNVVVMRMKMIEMLFVQPDVAVLVVIVDMNVALPLVEYFS
jgi:hypothetical protein